MSNPDYKEGRGDYYLAAGLREQIEKARRDERKATVERIRAALGPALLFTEFSFVIKEGEDTRIKYELVPHASILAILDAEAER